MGATDKDAIANLIIGGRKLKANEYIGAMDEALGKNVKTILDRLGIDLVQKLEEFAPSASGKLSSTIKVIGVKENSNGYRLEIGFGVDYHDYIDKGVRGVENKRKTYPNIEGRHYQFKTLQMPLTAMKGLQQWMKDKNMQIRAENKIANQGKKRKKKPKLINQSVMDLAKNIKKNGIAGRMYKKKAIDSVLPEYEVLLSQVGFNSLILKVSK